MLPTYDQLCSLFPDARDGYLRALADNERLLSQHGLDHESGLPLAHFLAQVAHETGGFKIIAESGNFSAERIRALWPNRFTPGEARAYARRPQATLNRAYARKDLGNGGEASGDGWRYRGRSFMQTTGKANYQAISNHTGVDLVARPELLETDFTLGLRAALIEWSALDLGTIAKRGATHEACLAISRGINCGSVKSGIQPNGFADRKAWLAKIYAALTRCGVPSALDPAADGILEEGESGEAVRYMQDLLARLGYPVGAADGIFGARSRMAVAAFQHNQNLPVDGRWRVEYRDFGDLKVFTDAQREHATIDDVRRAGEPTAHAANWLKRGAGGVAAFLGIGEAAERSGTLAGMREIVEPLAGNLAWLVSSKWVLGLAAAIGVYLAARLIEARIVERWRAFKVQP